jgi:hypothetical protein
MRVFVAGCFALVVLAPGAARADTTFIVETDTSPILTEFGSGYTGYVDLQYNALSGAGLSTATITEFSSDGTLGGCVPESSCVTGDASGDLSSTVTIGNGALDNSSYNDFNEAITFGTFVDFVVTLSGPPGGTNSSTFTLSYFETDDSTPLLSADPTGASGTITIQPSGAVATETYKAADNNYYTTITMAPEPSSALPLGAVLLLAAGVAVRTRFQRRAA